MKIPTPLKHIRFADFRDNREEGLSQLLEALTPGHILWKSLAHHYDHFCLLSEQFRRRDLDEAAAEDLTKIHDLLDTALNLRTEIELRRTRQRIRDYNLFEKIGLLVEKGIDVRSQTWNALVSFRASLAHDMKGGQAHLHAFAQMLDARHDAGDMREGFLKGLARISHQA